MLRVDEILNLSREEMISSSKKFVASLCTQYKKNNYIDPSFYQKLDVKRGLRNPDGTGVMAGVTLIGDVQGYIIRDGEKVPKEGDLIYRGISIKDLINGFVSENRFGYEETVYLLLFGELPTASVLEDFKQLLCEWSALPPGFTEDMIIKAPSNNVMNKLARSILALYSYDDEPEPTKSGDRAVSGLAHDCALSDLSSRTPTPLSGHYF